LFAASDNKNIDLNDYPEVRNRALIVSTDTSAGLTKRVKKRQAAIEVGRYEQKLTGERRQEIRDYIDSIPVDLYTGDSDVGEVWNMTHGGFAEENPLPDLFPESRMDFERFNKFVKAVTLFHYDERMELSNGSRDSTVSLVSAPEDLWLAWKVFGEKMVLSALNLDDKDFEVLELLRDSAQAKTVADVQNEIRDSGQNLSDTQIRNSLDGMQDKGYVIKDTDGGRVSYQPSPFATPDNVSKDISIDFEVIVEQTKDDARYMLPEDTAEEYISQYCEGEGLITTHPTEGGQVNIIESDLGDAISEKGEKEAEAVAENNPFDKDDDDDPDPEDEPKIQGTIG
jgi:predicted transcriptional regulator